MKIFDSVNLQYDNLSDVHTKTAILNALLLTWFTASPYSRCQFEAISSLDPEGLLSTCMPTQAIALANKAVEKIIVDKGLDKKHVH